MKYDPNCAWYDFTCTSDPSGCAWYDPLCAIGADVNKVVTPIYGLIALIVIVAVAGLVLVAFSPVGKRFPMPRLG